MKSWRLAAALTVLASAVAPQDFAPGVLTLAHFKIHMRDEISHLPNYTCLETVSRFYRQAGRGERLNPLDVVHLEIVYSDHHEWYGSPGDRNMGVDNPVKFVGSGLMGSGAFALTLNNVLSLATFSYRGEEPVNGRPGIRYDFQYSRESGGFEISLVGGKGSVGQKGSLWIDPQSLDLIRMEANADDIPSYLPLAASRTTVDYAATRIGERTVLLAQQAELQLSELKNGTGYDHIEFTHCRAFAVESTISFGDQSAETASVADKHQAATPSIPANHQVTVQLTTPITSQDAVGKLIEGKVIGDVINKGAILVRSGAAVKGRIRRLERYQGNGRPEFILGLEFTEVEASGGPTPFYADFLRMDTTAGVLPNLKQRSVVHDTVDGKTTDETITLAELPGVVSFFVAGQSFSISAGFKTVWRTRGSIRGT